MAIQVTAQHFAADDGKANAPTTEADAKLAKVFRLPGKRATTEARDDGKNSKTTEADAKFSKAFRMAKGIKLFRSAASKPGAATASKPRPNGQTPRRELLGVTPPARVRGSWTQTEFLQQLGKLNARDTLERRESRAWFESRGFSVG